ncbi:MAG TPA: hypothetical protein VM370_11720 [Candidatus Thermoplasmatota archaeon]|nr:hypothetical protein [Candidatus Thermoplasmatota archaeon]
MRSWLALALALVAGCASEPPGPLVAGEPAYGDGPPFLPEEPPTLLWETIAAGDLLLSPSQSALAVTVPNGTIRIMTNFTLVAGSGYGLGLQLGECQRRVDALLSGPGAVLPVDCGGVLDGSTQLQVTLTAGAIEARAEVLALTCTAPPGHWRCPGRAPVPEG